MGTSQCSEYHGGNQVFRKSCGYPSVQNIKWASDSSEYYRTIISDQNIMEAIKCAKYHRNIQVFRISLKY